MSIHLLAHQKPLTVSVPGKWILSGEHAVLRGEPALAMVCSEVRLSLFFEPFEDPNRLGLEVEPQEAETLILTLMKRLQAYVWNHHHVQGEGLSGRLKLKSTIPVGAGLGSSAALCVALSQWYLQVLGLPQDDLSRLATHLEDHFHGKSSGMDVAVIIAGEPVVFVQGKGADLLGMDRLPLFSLHDTGLRSPTHLLVAQVNQFRKDQPREGKRMDAQMGEATRLLQSGLSLYQQKSVSLALDQLAKGIEMAHACFEAWGLTLPVIQQEKQQLLRQGALAVKLTGAGKGGMLVALWPESFREQKAFQTLKMKKSIAGVQF